MLFGRRIGPGGWYLTYPGDIFAFSIFLPPGVVSRGVVLSKRERGYVLYCTSYIPGIRCTYIYSALCCCYRTD